MRIAIIGAGVAGRSLYRFLELDGMLDIHEVEIFDLERPCKSMCKIHPCAWGVKTPEWKRACAMLETKTRVLREFTRIYRNDSLVRCDLCTIDKPKFLDDICPEENIQRGGFDDDCSKYDLVVDATGEKRAVLPPLKDDMKITCWQAVFRADRENLDMGVFPSKSVGYSWVFPLKHPFVHIGGGAMKWDFGFTMPIETQNAMRYAGVMDKEPVCGWHESKIRLMSPIYSRPIVHQNVVGIGESVGAVSPNNGAGILPGIMSARLLADHIQDSSSNVLVGEPGYWKRLYEMDLIKMFGFLDRETEIIKKLINRKRVGIRDYICLYHNTRYFGMYPGIKDVLITLKSVGARFL